MRFWTRAQANPAHTALVAPDGTHVPAGELLERCNQLTHALRMEGLRHGDGIAIVMPNGTDLLVAYLAAMQGGWYLTPLNHHLIGAEIGYIVGDCEAKVLIGDARYADACREAADIAGLATEQCFSVSGSIDGFRSLDDVLGGQPIERPERLSAGAIMYYTSGTTGRPKGVRRALPEEHPDEVAGPFEDLLRLLGIDARSDDVHLCGSPLYHTAVLAFAADALHLGQTVIVMDRWTPSSMLDLIEEHEVTNTHMVPTQFHRLLGLPEDERDAANVSSLRYVVHGAAPCPVDQKQRMIEWWGPKIYEYYGTTEGGGTIVGPKDWLDHPGTVGLPWPGAEIRILDEKGDDAPADEPGTVYIKLAESGFEYFKDDEKTSESRIEGYFTVGDIGYLDEEGYLYLCDRSSNLIVSGGVNIYPAEIEGAILSHPSVGDVAVFGIPDREFGERVHAVIEPVPGVEPGGDLEIDLDRHCRQHLAGFKVPRSWEFTTELPRDPSGKLFKRTLRDAHWGRAAP